MQKNKVDPAKTLSREAVISIAIHASYQFGTSIAMIFINLYLWRLTESIAINGIYNAVIYIMGPITFAFAGKLAKTHDRLFVYRLGILLMTIFFIMIVFMQEKVADYYVLAGMLFGGFSSFYWLGYSTIVYDVSNDQNRIRYMAITSIVVSLASLLGPLIAGAVISWNEGLYGYLVIFGISGLMFSITTIGSFQLRADKTHHKSYYLQLMPQVIRKNPWFLKGLFGWLILGLTQGIVMFLPPILLYSVLEQEAAVGALNMLFYGLTMGVGFLLARYSKADRTLLLIAIGAIGYCFAAGFLVLGLNLFTVIAFMIGHSLASPLLNNAFGAYHYRLINKLPLKGNLKIETSVMRQVFLNFGRVIPIFIIVFTAVDLHAPWIGWVVFATALLQISLVWLSKE